MSTITVNKNNYAVKENHEKRVSIKERLRNYYAENAETITAGLLFMNGSTTPYTLYRSMR